MTLIYKGDVDIPKIYLQTKNELSRSRHSKFTTRTGHKDTLYLLLWPWPWPLPDDLDIPTRPGYSKMYLRTKNELFGSRLSKVGAF